MIPGPLELEECFKHSTSQKSACSRCGSGTNCLGHITYNSASHTVATQAVLHMHSSKPSPACLPLLPPSPGRTRQTGRAAECLLLTMMWQMKVNSYAGATLCHAMHSKQKESREIRSKSTSLIPVCRRTANTIALFFHLKLHLKKVANTNTKYQWKVFITLEFLRHLPS